MEKIDLYAVIKKLTGPIDPVGSTHIDNDRFANLEYLTEAIDKLLTDIDAVAYNNKSMQEYSIKQAVELVEKFQARNGIQE